MDKRWWTWLALAAPLVWFFGGVMSRGEALDFRDIGHYYRPLWHWTSAEWAAGRVPLWCELDGLGMPVHADPTASIFYPGQLLFALPLSFTTRLNLYVALHVLLAAVTLYRTARGFGASRAGAVAGALAYAYGGHVLFQYCNPIYLVSAAWLPLAALAIERTFMRRSVAWALTLAVALALMVLGGDPQMAYHLGLLALLYVWLKRTEAVRESMPLSRRPFTLLMLSALVAGGLAAVQWLPTAQHAARSLRSASDVPRSVWELPRGGDASQGLLGDPAADSHHERIYDFSVGPWRWLEFAWPNVGGRMFPQHQRWMTGIPAEGRVWTPSLYLGLAPLLVALSAFSMRRRRDATTRWLSWMTLFGLLGSLGVYGLGWLWEELRWGIGGDPEAKQVHGAVGGLYWLMVVVLPGYVQFRYPAKLMVLAALGLSLLAARGWDDALQQRLRTRKFWTIACAGLVVGSLAITGIVLSQRSMLATLPAEYPFGPFLAERAVRDVLFAALQTGVLATLVYFMVSKFRERAWLPRALALVTALDLCLAHAWLISASPPTEVVAATGGRIYRGAIDEHAPVEWSTTSSPDRVADVLAWQEATLGEKCFLAARANVADTRSALEPADLEAVAELMRKHGVEAMAPALGIDAQLTVSHDQLMPKRLREENWPDVCCPQTVYFRHELKSRRWSDLQAQAAEVFLDNGMPADRRAAAFVELDRDTADLKASEIFAAKIGGDALRLRRISPSHLEVDYDLPETRVIVVADYFAPGWTAETIDRATGARRPGEVVRANRVLRGVVVPPGKQCLVMRYRPMTFYVGAAVSMLAWLCVAGFAVARLRRLPPNENLE